MQSEKLRREFITTLVRIPLGPITGACSKKNFDLKSIRKRRLCNAAIAGHKPGEMQSENKIKEIQMGGFIVALMTYIVAYGILGYM